MMKSQLWTFLFCLIIFKQSLGMQSQMHDHHSMSHDANGMVMNANHDILPQGCEKISNEQHITVRAGQQYANDIPGTIFGMDKHEWNVDPCSKLTVTFINEDDIRHQWMVHGLPKYLYPAGMFHIEAMAGKTTTGTFIVPSEDQNYLVHCDMAQHMEMGMRGQLVVGKGGGDLWAVTGVTKPFYKASYLSDNLVYLCLIILFIGYFLPTWLVRLRHKR